MTPNRANRRHGAGAVPPLLGLGPIVDPDVELLVLGSFPGAASLAAQAYYAHPRNQFWPIMEAILGETLISIAYQARLARLLARGIGLWDVYASCRRAGSLDAAIREALPNPVGDLLQRQPRIRAIAFNGRAAGQSAAILTRDGVAVAVLPSTSPAYAMQTLVQKCQAWTAFFGRSGLPRPAANEVSENR